MQKIIDKSKWKRLSSETVFDDRVKLVKYEVELFDGSKSGYIVDEAKPAAAILIRVANNLLVLNQYRFPLDSWIYDLPGGRVDDTESIDNGVIRECIEETGYTPTKLQLLGKFFPNPGRSNWPVYLYFSNSSEKNRKTSDDPSESIDFELLPIVKVEKMILDGEIIDPSLIIAFHLAKGRGLLD